MRGADREQIHNVISPFSYFHHNYVIMIGFLPSFSAEVVIWGWLWRLCWRSEERQSGMQAWPQLNSKNSTTLQVLHQGTEPATLSSTHTFPPLHMTPSRVFNIQSSGASVLYAPAPFQQKQIETLWNQCQEGSITHRPCLLSCSRLSHTPLWPSAGELLGWCYIFNESRVFDLPMFIFFDVKWHSGEQPARNVVQHEDRLIHYPSAGAGGSWLRGSRWRSHHLQRLWGRPCACNAEPPPAQCPLWGNAHECKRYKCMRGYLQ